MIKKYELMHGAVLTRICRNDQPVALTLIESDDQRATYKLNDSILLYMKYSTSPRGNGKLIWKYTFTSDHIRDLQKHMMENTVYMALVCGCENLENTNDMQICFLESEDIKACLDLSFADQQTITVEAKRNESLRVYGSARDKDKLIVARNRLDRWQVPGR